MPRSDPSARVRRHALELLTDRPHLEPDLLDALLERGLDLGPMPDERLEHILADTPLVDWLAIADDRGDTEVIYHRTAILDGLIWHTAITRLEVESDTLGVDALGPLSIPLINGWCHLEGVETVQIDLAGQRRTTAEALGVDGGAGLVMPNGWLAGQGADVGSILRLSVRGDTISTSVSDTAPAPTADLVDLLRARLSPDRPSAACRRLGDLWQELLVLHPELRGPDLPPIDDWLDAAGLERDGAWVAATGFDFAAERLRRNVEEVANAHGLSPTDTRGYAGFAVAWQRWQLGDRDLDRELLAECARTLGSPMVAGAVTSEAIVLETIADDVDDLVGFGEAILHAARGRDRANAAWLIATSLDAAGRPDRAEGWFDTALGFNPDHPLALYEAASIPFDRGDARAARSLLWRIGVDLVEPDIELLDSMLALAEPQVGRNDPCPCGSGRKYKQCHLGRFAVPLVERVAWLTRKVNWYLERRHRDEVEAMAWLRAQHGTRSPAELLQVDPLIVDAVLVEGGRFADWLADRGALLPDDEALLAAQWSLIERSVFEVTSVRPHEGLTLRDLRTGEVVEVHERLGTRGMATGRYILTRVLPVGDGTSQLFGGITIVPDAMRDRFIDLLDGEPTSGQLMLLVAESEAPPTMVTSDGDELVHCQLTWSVGRPPSDALDARFGPADDGRWTWYPDEQDAGDGGRRVLGSLELVADELVATTQSVERATRLVALVAEVIPDAVLVEELHSTLDDLRADLDELAEEGGDDRSPFDVANAEQDPELRFVLLHYIEAHERSWVDEPVPALGGLTPRAALDDPTRRDDVLRLLERIERAEAEAVAAGTTPMMSADRVRALLGLETS